MKETIISTSTTRQLLSLLRASLWQTSVDTAPFQSDVDWDAIITLALQQTVGALVIKAALSLPPDLLPPREWRHKALSFIERNKRTHLLLNNCVAEAQHQLKEADIPTVLLKGQAYAQAYPDPTLRQCGDIDLYVGDENYRKAYEATCKFGWQSTEEFLPKSKHYGCYLNGVRIELHRLAAELSSPSANRKFLDWSKNKGLTATNTTPTFDVIFVFLHLYHHFINGGIGLRQVCDWVMLLHRHAKDLDYTELTLRLKEFQLLKAWQYFTPIAVVYLGLPIAECPLYTEKYRKKSGKIFAFILKEGNFGRYGSPQADLPEGYWNRKFYTFRHFSSRMLPRLPIDPWIVLNTYTRTLCCGIRGIFHHFLNFTK